MSWEYDPADWVPTEEYRKDSVIAAMSHIVGDPDKVLSERKLWGVSFDTDDVNHLRMALAYMLIYKDME